MQLALPLIRNKAYFYGNYMINSFTCNLSDQIKSSTNGRDNDLYY